VIWKDARACVRFEDRWACFLDLKKERIIVSCHKKKHQQEVPTLPMPTTFTAAS
jgi:hypothetical protein